MRGSNAPSAVNHKDLLHRAGIETASWGTTICFRNLPSSASAEHLRLQHVLGVWHLVYEPLPCALRIDDGVYVGDRSRYRSLPGNSSAERVRLPDCHEGDLVLEDVGGRPDRGEIVTLVELGVRRDSSLRKCLSIVTKPVTGE